MFRGICVVLDRYIAARTLLYMIRWKDIRSGLLWQNRLDNFTVAFLLQAVRKMWTVSFCRPTVSACAWLEISSTTSLTVAVFRRAVHRWLCIASIRYLAGLCGRNLLFSCIKHRFSFMTLQMTAVSLGYGRFISPTFRSLMLNAY